MRFRPGIFHPVRSFLGNSERAADHLEVPVVIGGCNLEGSREVNAQAVIFGLVLHNCLDIDALQPGSQLDSTGNPGLNQVVRPLLTIPGQPGRQAQAVVNFQGLHQSLVIYPAGEKLCFNQGIVSGRAVIVLVPGIAPIHKPI